LKNVICDYCGTPAEFIDSAAIYGKSYGMVYRCPNCGAYVGCHKGTDKPLGRLANKELRTWKMKAHDAFDPIWKSHKMRRPAAYKWLSEQMGIPWDKTHIGMFDIEQCKQVIKICNAALRLKG
jgi:hypothetical protein